MILIIIRNYLLFNNKTRMKNLQLKNSQWVRICLVLVILIKFSMIILGQYQKWVQLLNLRLNKKNLK